MKTAIDKRTRTLAKNMRKRMTRQEYRLYSRFLSSLPVTVCRQKVIGNYIVDFYCAKARLVVEIDGSQHYEDQGLEYDRTRTAYLESLGLRVVRFSNYDVDVRVEGVCATIDGLIRDGM